MEELAQLSKTLKESRLSKDLSRSSLAGTTVKILKKYLTYFGATLMRQKKKTASNTTTRETLKSRITLSILELTT